MGYKLNYIGRGSMFQIFKSNGCIKCQLISRWKEEARSEFYYNLSGSVAPS